MRYLFFDPRKISFAQWHDATYNAVSKEIDYGAYLELVIDGCRVVISDDPEEAKLLVEAHCPNLLPP